MQEHRQVLVEKTLPLVFGLFVSDSDGVVKNYD